MSSKEAQDNGNMSQQYNDTNNLDPNSHNQNGINEDVTTFSAHQQHNNNHDNTNRLLGSSSKKAVPAAIQHPSQGSKQLTQQKLPQSPQVTASSSSSSSIPPVMLQKAISSVLPQPHQSPLIPQESNQSSQKPASRLSKYTRIRIIGRGAYGIVSLVRNLSGQYLAMKEVDQMKLRKDSKAHQAYMEKIVCNFSHPGIPQFHSCFREGDKLYFVMAYIEGELLSQLIKKHQDLLNEQIIQFYIAEIVLTLEYIHSLGFSHRDLKAENLVLTKEGHIQLIDYGTLNDYCKQLIPPEALENVKAKDAHRRDRITSKKKSEIAKQLEENDRLQNQGIDDSSAFSENRGLSKRIKEIKLTSEDQEDIERRIRCQTFCGTAEYLCPEMLEDQCCEMSGDLWALGCLIYKLFTNVTPFIDESQLLIFQRIKQGSYNKQHEKIPPTAESLIDALLVADSHSRLGSVIVDQNTTINSVHQAYNQLKAHPFFDGIQWESLYSNSPPKCVVDMLNTIRNPAFKANIPKDINDICNNSDDEEDFDDDEDGFGNEQAIDKLRKTFDSARKANSKSQQFTNQSESPKKLSQLRKSEGYVLTKTKSSPEKNKSNDNLQSLGKHFSEQHSGELTYIEMVSQLGEPFTMENLFFQVQIIKINKHLLVFSTKRPRQILLFNVEPITIIYYIPMSQNPSIKRIILDDSTQIILESQEKISFQDAKQKYIFQEAKGNSPGLLYDAIQRLKKQRAKGQ